jgi:phenylalanyl-tRNA synthetase alpha chain
MAVAQGAAIFVYDTMNDLDTLVRAAQSAFDAAPTPAELENAKARFLG